MLMQGWAIALSVTFAATFFLALCALVSAVRVLRHWDQGADTARQIRLEQEVWLASAAMQYGLVFEVLSLLLLVLAADSFSGQLAGAMCASGALTANGFGFPALLVKIVVVFASGFWLLLHRLDLEVETMPLVRRKFAVLPGLVALLALDGVLQTSYLLALSPDVITSCCGVLFNPGATDGFNLLAPSSPLVVLSPFSLLAVLLVLLGCRLLAGFRQNLPLPFWLPLLYGGCWALFFVVALWAVTVFFSSYFYMLPSHRCPFDLLQREYGWVGYPIYLSLFWGAYLGMGSGIAALVGRMEGLSAPCRNWQQRSVKLSLWLLAGFLVVCSAAPLRYLMSGGEG